MSELPVTLNKDIYSETGTVGWLCVLNVGEPIKNDHHWVWTKKKQQPIFNGYQCARIVRDELSIIATLQNIRNLIG